MTDLLILRPEPGAGTTAARAAAMGLGAIVAPLFDMVAVAWTPPAGRYEALMLTSANAVRHAGPALARYRALPVHAVGAATARAAAEAGLTVRRVGEGDAAALLAGMAGDGVGRALHLCGADHRAVAQPGMMVDRIVVYRAEPVARLPVAAGNALDARAIALLHSPRAAATFAALADADARARTTIAAAAISAAAADALGSGWRRIGIAAAPTDRALLAVAAAMCEERETWPPERG